MEQWEQNMFDITGLIMVRSGSVRCKNKNIRRFADTSLLENKIKALSNVSGLNRVVVNSDCPVMLDVARSNGVGVVQRDPKYATSETNPRDLYKHVAESIETSHVLSASVCYPMMSINTYKDMIRIYNTGEHESVVACHAVKHHMWIGGEHGYRPLNYEPGSQPNSQELPEVVSVCWGGIVTSVETMRKGDLVGRKPYFYEVSEHESLDIDTELDFIMSEAAYRNINDLVGCMCSRGRECCRMRNKE